ncbi:MAG: WYL domain-containing protein [Saprospiraceae bacterium]|nr:WYL domain-containing protein [Saprospiraceae bacterium]MDW8483094.1 WYL domain-containing protein [Saprospiraceae bacterium]
MPTNKHAAFRYRVLDACFRRRRRWTIAELADEVGEQLREAFGVSSGVSERMLRYDISLMRSEPPRGFGAPIECRQGRYFYSDPEFSIEKRPLTQTDIEALREVVGVLQQFKGLPQLEALKGILTRMEGLARFPNRTLIQFETNEHVAGLEWLAPLYAAAHDQQALRVLYHPFTFEQPYEIVFHPYLLKEYRNRWFCLGLNEGEGKIHTLALDRICRVAVSEHPFQPNIFFNPDTYFQDIIGVSRPEGAVPTQVVFESTVLLSRYLETKPLHASQRLLERDEKRAVFCLTVVPNPEMYAELRRFGPALRVLAPEHVRSSMHYHGGGWDPLPKP